MTLYEILLLIISGQGFFLFFIFLFRKKKRFSDWFLAALVFIFSYHILYIFLIKSGYIFSFPYLIATCFCLQTLIPVTFYWYITKYNQANFQIEDWPHLLPFVFHFLLWVPFFFSSSQEKIMVLSGDSSYSIYQQLGFPGFVILQMLLFVFYSYKIREHYIQLTNGWVNKISWIFLIVSFFYLIDGTTYLLTGSQYYPMYHIILAILIYFIAYQSFNYQKEVFRKPKYSNSKLNDQSLQSLIDILDSYMRTKQPYLSKGIKLEDISKAIEYSDNEISQAINSYYEMSFPDYLNNFRIEEAKRLLKDDKDNELKNLAVAFDSGFNNKVSFYNYFSKFVGMTPKEFRESLNTGSKSVAG